MSEKKYEARRKALLANPKNGYDRVDAATREAIFAYAEGYKQFLDEGKTERECCAYVEAAAKARPDWQFVWIGNEKPGADLSALRAMKNVHFLGVKPNAELPKYLAQFDVCLNLFDAGPLSKDVSPLKFYEYLATGKPIVSTRQPDQVLQFADIIHIADDAKSFEKACEAALDDTQPERTNARIEAGRNSSWDARVGEICAVLREKGIL